MYPLKDTDLRRLLDKAPLRQPNWQALSQPMKKPDLGVLWHAN